MMNRKEMIRELEYAGASHLIKDINELYDYIDILYDIVPDWAKEKLFENEKN